MSFQKKASLLLEMIKFEHTIFALPFAMASAVVAARGIPALGTIGWILLAMVGARSAAMGFNRIADRKIDAQNPRTKSRAIPARLVSLAEAWILVIASAVLFILAAGMLNRLTLILSPLALIIVLGYSYTKRFTSFSHLILGLCLGIAPLGAWLAVQGTLGWPAIILAASVVAWTAGFDILYSLQDIDFDKKTGLFSLPKLMGPTGALMISRLLHILTVGFLLAFGILSRLGFFYFGGIILVTAALIYEHRLVRPDDFSKVNVAFFTMNGIVSVAFFIFTLADILLPITF